jgi:hypothetical protein
MTKVMRFELTAALTEEGGGGGALARFQRREGSSAVVLIQEAKGEGEGACMRFKGGEKGA